MKNDHSFKVLAAAVLAGLILSLVDASSARETGGSGASPVASAPVAVVALAQR